MTDKRVVEILRLFERKECAVAKSACRVNAGDNDVADYYGERIAALRVAIHCVEEYYKNIGGANAKEAAR